MTEVSDVIQVSKGITDYGALVIIGAVYIILTAAMMITMFKWFKGVITMIINDNREGIRDIRTETHRQNELLADIAEGLRPETQLRIRNLTGFAFDLSVEQVCRLIKKVREENHIADKESTAKKIRKSLTVLHEDRSSRFDTFTYRGEKLSLFCNREWIEQVAKVVEGEIYHEDGANNGRAYTNVRLAYDDIKTDFYKRLSA